LLLDICYLQQQQPKAKVMLSRLRINRAPAGDCCGQLLLLGMRSVVHQRASVLEVLLSLAHLLLLLLWRWGC
jgi:hypothetical protein